MDTPHSEHHAPNIKMYLAVFGALLILTLVTVAVSKLHLPRPQAIAVGLFVATIKASLVAAVFMHLWGENKLIYKILLVAAALSVMFLVPIIDSHLLINNNLQRMPVADQHPAEK